MSTIMRIGHASTGKSVLEKQVLIVDDYDINSLDPRVLLRPVDSVIAETSARICEAGCNNNVIGYSQNTRTTLYTEAKKVNFDLSAITTRCQTDCSAFMGLCAYAAGVKVSSSTKVSSSAINADCGSLESCLTANGAYKAYRDSKYLTSTDYLQRGDILVRDIYNHAGHESRHTVMVLGDGPSASLIGAITKITLTISNIRQTSVTAKVRITKLENGEEQDLDVSKDIKQYKWYYTIRALDKANTKDVQLEITSGIKTFSINNLSPSNSYMLKVYASSNGTEDTLSSSNLIFTTKQVDVGSVKNLNISFENTGNLDKKCNITFDPPDWPSLSEKKGYRVSLILNGKTVASSDQTIRASNAHVNKTILLSDLIEINTIKYTDIVQIGIQPWIQQDNKFIFDKTSERCSKPFYICSLLKSVDKTYMRVEHEFKHAIIDSGRKED